MALRKNNCAAVLCNALGASFIALLTISTPLASRAQTRPAVNNYMRTNSYAIIGAYSGDSSHIFLGYAEKRKLVDFGVSYGRRILSNRIVNWQYNGELLPVALESDPMGQEVISQTSPAVETVILSTGPLVSCAPVSASYSFVDQNGVLFAGTDSLSCHGRKWNIGEAMSPVGFEWNFLPRRKTQLFLVGHGGYMYSTQPIPLQFAGSFNFTFDFGAGLEFYRSMTRSVRVEYRVHHISNHGTAQVNPGIDNGLLQVSYVFGH